MVIIQLRMTNGCDNDDDDHDNKDDDDDNLDLLAPCQQLTRTLALGLLARLDRIHMPDK